MSKWMRGNGCVLQNIRVQLLTFFFNGDNVEKKQLIRALHKAQVNSSGPITQLKLNTVFLASVDDTPIAPPPQLNAWLANTQDTPLASPLLLIAEAGVVVV